MNTLSRIEVEGFKSLKNIDLSLRSLNVLIGANGAGKSNFVSLFEMLNFLTTEGLQLFVGLNGGANSLLYYSARVTPQMRIKLHFETDSGTSGYYMRLMDAAPDTLIYAEEAIYYTKKGYSFPPLEIQLGAGHKETRLNESKERGSKITEQIMRLIISKCKVFQFHDTSKTSLIRRKGNIQDNKYLKSNAGNIAAYLYMLKLSKREYYERIVSTIRLVAPHFGNFEMEPDSIDSNSIMLNWYEAGSDYLFGPHQLSDGLLRFMALTTLLLMPEDSLPSVIIIDEPELGLHPYAINVLGSILKKASKHCQVVLATQSVNLLDQFAPEDIIVVQRNKGESAFERLGEKALDEWLKEYTIGELWEKNVIGGRPSR